MLNQSSQSFRDIRRKMAAIIVSTGLWTTTFSSSSSSPNIVIASDIPIPSTSESIVESASSKLTADQLLQINIQPRILLLKDIATSFKQYDSYAEAKDYLSIRSALRQEPTVELRKTCRSLEKYLTLEKQAGFRKAYDAMISSVDDLDGLAFRRSRGDNVPVAEKQDEETIGAVRDTAKKLDLLISIAEN